MREGMRHEEAFWLSSRNEDPGVLSQKNDSKLKNFYTLEDKSFHFICKFLGNTVQKVIGKSTELCCGKIVLSNGNYIIFMIISRITECI